MSEAITPWIHIVAVTAWLGPQFFLFVAAGPAFRLIDDPAVRAKVVRVLVTRFGWLAWSALAVIVLTGISNLFQEANDFAFVWDPDYRYFQVFSTKMTLTGVMVLLTALHTFVIGPRQLRLQEDARSDSEEAYRLRRLSVFVSGLALLLGIAVVFAAALLANHEYSHQPI